MRWCHPGRSSCVSRPFVQWVPLGTVADMTTKLMRGFKTQNPPFHTVRPLFLHSVQTRRTTGKRHWLRGIVTILLEFAFFLWVTHGRYLSPEPNTTFFWIIFSVLMHYFPPLVTSNFLCQLTFFFVFSL